jgi:hypothetical protein
MRYINAVLLVLMTLSVPGCAGHPSAREFTLPGYSNPPWIQAEADFNAGDLRFLSIVGLAEVVPGMEDRLEAVDKYHTRVIAKGACTLPTDRAEELADYASVYNVVKYRLIVDRERTQEVGKGNNREGRD